MAERPVLLFDGVCSLCNATVDFVLRHERDDAVQFAALQSEAARELLGARLSPAEQARLLGRRDGALDTVVWIAGERVLERSSAVLALAAHLRAPWRWLRIGLVVPRVLRDVLYDFIARHRYAWFGKKETCRVPTRAERARFLG